MGSQGGDAVTHPVAAGALLPLWPSSSAPECQQKQSRAKPGHSDVLGQRTRQTPSPPFSPDELLGTHTVLEASLSSFPTPSRGTWLGTPTCSELQDLHQSWSKNSQGRQHAMSPSADGPLHSPQDLPRLLTDQGLKGPPGNSLHRELGGDLSPSVRCRTAAEGQLQPRPSARSSGDAACTSKQGEQGLATAGHSAQGGVGTPISLRSHREW